MGSRKNVNRFPYIVASYPQFPWLLMAPSTVGRCWWDANRRMQRRMRKMPDDSDIFSGYVWCPGRVIKWMERSLCIYLRQHVCPLLLKYIVYQEKYPLITWKLKLRWNCWSFNSFTLVIKSVIRKLRPPCTVFAFHIHLTNVFPVYPMRSNPSVSAWGEGIAVDTCSHGVHIVHSQAGGEFIKKKRRNIPE